MAEPHKMGAALTYARRYALFTLVGIAGEDDLDAPDLPATNPAGGVTTPRTSGKMNGYILSPTGKGAPTSDGSAHRNGTFGKAGPRIASAVLPAEASAALRDKLVGEIAALCSADAAVQWARASIAAKNTLSVADAAVVEASFRDCMQMLEGSAPTASDPAPINRPTSAETQAQEPEAKQRCSDEHLDKVDKSVLAIAEPRRYRNKEHLRFVTQQACLVCGRKPSDPHHLRFTQPRALGRKVSDEFVAPLCRIHHRAVHRAGDERMWWKELGIDPIRVARRLWKQARPRDGSLQPNLRTAPPAGVDNPAS
jgi:ERF superfamily protein